MPGLRLSTEGFPIPPGLMVGLVKTHPMFHVKRSGHRSDGQIAEPECFPKGVYREPSVKPPRSPARHGGRTLDVPFLVSREAAFIVDTISTPAPDFRHAPRPNLGLRRATNLA